VNDSLLDRMRARARAVAARAVVRRWNYRQRHLAAGVWYRLRRVLADADAAYVIADEDARQLVADGYAPEPCGHDIVPAKMIFFVDPVRLSTLESRRRIRVDLGPAFLAARSVALVPFGQRDAGRPG
jgi:hypothetical protein